MIIRPLTAFEREAVRSFYLALSTEDRHKRFCCSLSDETIWRYVDRLDFGRDVILGAFGEDAQLIGLAELVHGAAASEMAFSVRPDKRGKKIGTKLLEKLLQCARVRGVGKAFVLFLANNTPMRRMASRAGMTLDLGDGEAHAVLELPAPSADELARWALEESLCYAGHCGAAPAGRRNTHVDPRVPAANEPQILSAAI